MGPVGARPGMGRRGEEAHVSSVIAGLGMPILRTIHGSGLFEGGQLRAPERHDGGGRAVVPPERGGARARSRRCSRPRHPPPPRAAGRTRAAHRRRSSSWSTDDLALINIERTPYWFLDTLRDLKIRWVEVHHADNPRVLNCLAVRPGKVLLAINNGDGTAERLVDHGVEVVPLQYAECQRNGGGIHCSTLPLVRGRS